MVSCFSFQDMSLLLIRQIHLVTSQPGRLNQDIWRRYEENWWRCSLFLMFRLNVWLKHTEIYWRTAMQDFISALILKETVRAKCPGVMSKISLCHLNGSVSQQAHRRHNVQRETSCRSSSCWDKNYSTSCLLKTHNNKLIIITEWKQFF